MFYVNASTSSFSFDITLRHCNGFLCEKTNNYHYVFVISTLNK